MNALRLLYFTDTHIRGTSPKNRKDDFLITLENKINEIIKISKENNIDYILHGGDLFDRPDISISVVSRFAKLFKEFNKPIFMISGNHDVYGHNPKTINRSILGLLKEVDLLNIIEEDSKTILSKEGIKLQLTGQPYIYNMDSILKRKNYIVDNIDKGVDYSIHLVHGMLLDKPFIKGIPYTLVDDILETKADITLAGHYHSGFNTIIHDGRYFINPGSIVRISNSLRELERKPKVIIIDLKDEISITDVYLKTALKGEEVLDRTEIEKNIYKREQLYEFKQAIDQTVDFDKIDINDVLIEVSNAEGVTDEVKIEALKRISLVQMKGLDKD